MGQFRDRPTINRHSERIPGVEVIGDSVAQMWLEGKLPEIVEYNEFDAFTTHLLWARVAHSLGYYQPINIWRNKNGSGSVGIRISQNRPHLCRFVKVGPFT